MEGNECYKLTTIRRFLEVTGAHPVRLAIDIGCNVGEVTALIRFHFPSAEVFAFEPVDEYYRSAVRRLAPDPAVKVFRAAVCGLHRFEDDLGTKRRSEPMEMKILKGREGAGPGWRGGSMIFARDQPIADLTRYAPQEAQVHCLTLDELLNVIEALTGFAEVDYMKMDCEGCECDVLGCASLESLRRIRFIGGEYHDLKRFSRVIADKLEKTHNINLLGGGWGSFFCERIGGSHCILSPGRTPFVPDEDLDLSIDHHVFHQQYVPTHERAAHGLVSTLDNDYPGQ